MAYILIRDYVSVQTRFDEENIEQHGADVTAAVTRNHSIGHFTPTVEL
jgi:hypothetical protein